MTESIHVFLDGQSDERKAEIMARLTPERREALLNRALPGVRTETGATLEEALRANNADFEVALKPTMAVLDADHAVEIPGRFAPCRLDTGHPLGVVGGLHRPRYTVHQTLSQLAPVKVLMDQGDMELNSIQVVDGGAKIRVSGLLGASTLTRLDGSPDVLGHFGVFEASHDGMSCNTGALQSLRLVCLNGLTSWQDVTKYKIRHTKNAEERIVDACRMVLGMREEAITEIRAFQAMATAPMTVDEFVKFSGGLLDAIRGELDEESTDAAKTRRERETDELVDLFRNGTGNDGQSLWDGYNSVTEWVDHQRNRKDTATRFNFDSATFGAGNKVKAKARRMLTR